MTKIYALLSNFVLLLLLIISSFGFGQVSKTFNSSETFIVPLGVSSIKVQAWGSGSGGYWSNNHGGGGGAFAGNAATNVTPGNSYAVTVGVGGKTGSGVGQDGQDSSFGTLVIAKGAIGRNGGLGSSSTGDIRFSGGNGGIGGVYAILTAGGGGGGSAGAGRAGQTGEDKPAGSSDAGKGGAGGAGLSGWDPGARGGNGGKSTRDGEPGQVPGGGGGQRGGGTATSGIGGNGQVIVTYRCPLNGGVLTGSSAVCIGTPVSFSSTFLGGTWSSLNPTIATVNSSTGLVTGVTAGDATIRYSITSASCGTTSSDYAVTVNSLPNATISANASSLCIGSDVIFTITGTAGATVTYNLNGGTNTTALLTGGSKIVTIPGALTSQTLKLVSITRNDCSVSLSAAFTVTIGNITIWNGSAWDKGAPTITMIAIIEGNYSGAADINACTLIVKNNAKVTIPSGRSVTVNGNIEVNAGSEFTIESDGNLVQVSDAAINTGNITAQRTIALRGDRNQYNYLISPVVGQSLKTIYPNIDFVLYYNESNDFFYSSSGAYIAGRGLAVKVPNANTTSTSVSANFVGVPANGTISFSLAFTKASRGFNLAGNPYPSTIDLKALYTLNKSIINSTFSYWDNSKNEKYTQEGTGYDGNSYAKYNAVSDTGTPAGGSTTLTEGLNRYAKVGQGFIIQALSANKLTYNNSIRKKDNQGANFYGKTGNAKNAETKNRYWLQLLSPAGIINTQAIVYFSEGDDGFGKDDSEIDGTISDVFYSVTDAQKVIIQGKSAFTDTDNIILGANIFRNGNYTISLENQEGIFANGQNIYLKDKQTGIITNLSQGTYTFNAAQGDNSTRFEIIYKPETVLATAGSTKDQLIVYKDGADFVVKSQHQNITGLEVYDALGRLIVKLQPNQTKVIIPGESLVNGVYILKINQNGFITSKKIIR